MRLREIFEDGRIVKGVNTTVDVGTDEIKTQAIKFGNKVDKDGRPPTLSKRVKGKSTNVLFNLGMNEGYKLQLERDKELLVLNITDTATGKRTEVRGKAGYESGGYDAKDKLHQLLDRVGKSANISELINGEVVTINPKHPDGAKAKAATDAAYNESNLFTEALAIEEGWKDWVAGGAMALGAMGAQAGNISTQIVDPGDTVYKIARDNGVDPKVIMKLNGFTNDTKLKPGQEVKVPDVYTDKGSINKAVKQAIADKPDSKLAPKTSLKPKPRTTELKKPKTSNAHENLLIKTATAAGIKGTELAAFLSQVAHESHDFQSMVEYGGSLDFRKYDPKYAPKKAKTLGNTRPGDGAKYKGRGYIQITGKYNYAQAGKALGLDLVKNPKLAEKPSVAAKIAVWYWKLRVQPNVDDFSNVKDVTKPINPGMRGLEDRKENFKDYTIKLASI